MEQPSSTTRWKTRLIFAAVAVLPVATGAGSWFYYHFRLNDLPPFQAKPLPPVRPIAAIVIAPQASAIPSTGASSEPSASTINAPENSRVRIERDPMDQFRRDTKLLALAELSSTFPDLQTVLQEQDENGSSPRDRQVIFQLLDAAKTSSADRRPTLLFAADMVASRLACDTFNTRPGPNADCAHLQADFSRYGLTLKYEELGGGMFYPHDLLWRIWAEYPQTPWGERTFVLLLDLGWDTSGTCEKGGDQTREVIRRGESFLQQRPKSPYQGLVTLLVAEAYASWWSLSNQPVGSDMSDYVDPKQFQEGADGARIKAIVYFEEVLHLAPRTELTKFADQVLPPLRDRQILHNHRFFCVYD